MRSRSLTESFRNAFRGSRHVLDTQPHIRLQILIGAVALMLGVLSGASRVEMLLLIFAVGLMLTAEFMNTALEEAVNVASQSFHPQARTAKDVAGGAVLVSCLVAAAIGGIVLLRPGRIRALLDAHHEPVADPVRIIVVGLIVLATVIMMVKLRAKKGSLTRGGVLSMHSAMAAFLVASVYYSGGSFMSVILAALLALLVCQSRIQAEIHSFGEVTLGAAVALLLAVALFQFLP
jgi:diacylglycerol kinase (ATP)